MQQTKKHLKIFGVIWAVIFTIIALFPLKSGDGLRVWAIYPAAIFMLTALTFPRIYTLIYFYQSWVKFGNFIGHINSKIIIGFLFFFIFVPTGLIFKILKKDPLARKFDKNAESYFVNRDKQAGSMKNQF